MSSLFLRLQARFGHLSDDTVAAFISGELNTFRSVRVNGHLSRCWQCRARRDALERAALLIVQHRTRNLATCLPLDIQARQRFLRKIEQIGQQPPTTSLWLSLRKGLKGHLQSMNPVFASVVVVSLACVFLFWIWQRSVPTVSAEELLRRAAASEINHSLRQPSGVLYQQVSIRSVHGSIRHAIYRDLSGQRKARPIALSSAENKVQQQLHSAGVNWDDPLSASAYKQWRDAQVDCHDEVRQLNGNELTLTTILPQGEIAEESLTVREPDFHPIRRTIEMRSQGTIEVAELDYVVLGWNAVNEGLFEPLSLKSATVSDTPLMHAVLPRKLPSPMQIDMAELNVRALLNGAHAGSEDQIRISHSATEILVKGIVKTNQRKKELIAQLDQVAYVRAEVLSIEEMSENPSPGSLSRRHGTSTPLQLYDAGDQVAPLAQFFETQKLPVEQLSSISKLLFDASAQVQSAGVQLEDLRRRFGSIEAMPQESQDSYNTLAHSYITAMRAGLSSERAVLQQIGLGETTQQSAVEGTTSTLEDTIKRNQRYCQELVTGGAAKPRSAAEIAIDIQQSASQVDAAVTALQASFPHR